ncbi:MAG: hypothetical protein AVDCRST_MAG02-3154, partial [uncultured Rubrobacteraceae bacterium]
AVSQAQPQVPSPLDRRRAGRRRAGRRRAAGGAGGIGRRRPPADR